MKIIMHLFGLSCMPDLLLRHVIVFDDIEVNLLD